MLYSESLCVSGGGRQYKSKPIPKKERGVNLFFGGGGDKYPKSMLTVQD